MSIYLIVGVVAIIFCFLLLIFCYYRDEIKDQNDTIEKLKQNVENLKQYKNFYKRESERHKWTFIVNEKTNSNKIEKVMKPNKKIKVLLADYNEMAASYTNRVLQSMGIDTDIVSSGQDIIDRLNVGYKYDAIITNNIFKNSPDGPTTLSILKNNDEFDVPVIILTVSMNKRYFFINDCGFDEYIEKAISIDKAQKALQNVIPKLKFTKEKKQ